MCCCALLAYERSSPDNIPRVCFNPGGRGRRRRVSGGAGHRAERRAGQRPQVVRALARLEMRPACVGSLTSRHTIPPPLAVQVCRTLACLDTPLAQWPSLTSRHANPPTSPRCAFGPPGNAASSPASTHIQARQPPLQQRKRGPRRRPGAEPCQNTRRRPRTCDERAGGCLTRLDVHSPHIQALCPTPSVQPLLGTPA